MKFALSALLILISGIVSVSANEVPVERPAESPIACSLIVDRVTGKPIPNAYILRNKLSLIDPTVQLQDPDGDGFLNEDEWRHETNPRDKKSHPPFHTKLFLLTWVGPTLRLKFTVFDGDLKTVGLKGMTFQINVWTGKWRTMFLRGGETDAQIDLQIVNFQEPGSLTVKLGGQEMLLPLGQEMEGPAGAARLLDDFGAGTEFVAKTGQVFSLGAKPSTQYKLLGLSLAGATVALPDGKRYLAPPLPEGLKKRQ